MKLWTLSKKGAELFIEIKYGHVLMGVRGLVFAKMYVIEIPEQFLFSKLIDMLQHILTTASSTNPSHTKKFQFFD